MAQFAVLAVALAIRPNTVMAAPRHVLLTLSYLLQLCAATQQALVTVQNIAVVNVLNVLQTNSLLVTFAELLPTLVMYLKFVMVLILTVQQTK